MIDKFYYAAHDYVEGDSSEYNETKRIVFGSGVYANYNDIRDYEWSYSTSRYGIGNFSKSAKEKRLPCVFLGKDRAETEDLRNKVYELFDRDVRLGKQGRIVINGYYLKCNVVATANSAYLSRRKIITEFKVVAADTTWHRDYELPIFEKFAEQSDGIDFPLAFPFDFGLTGNSHRKMFTNDCLVSCPFKLIIQGPCKDPEIDIAGHIYKVNGTLGSTETLEIISVNDKGERSIIKYGEDRSEVNWFSRRSKESSVFEPIPSGEVQIAWDGSFIFQLTLLHERSEPPWYTEPPVKPVKPVAYMYDADGGIIMDAYGEEIILR